MKRIFMVPALAILMLSACSEQFDSRRKIYVSGYAETEVTPDIIYFAVSLKEYFRAPGNKIAIESLEKQLYNAVLKAGIPKQNFTINDVSSYNMASQRQKNPDFAVRKQYRIKMSDLNKINTIIKGVDPKAIEYTQIEGYDYSKLETLKKEIKIKALKDARTKASYLAEAGESKLGKLLEVRESGAQNNVQTSNMMEAAAVVPQSLDQSLVVDFKKMKLSYAMSAVFELMPL